MQPEKLVNWGTFPGLSALVEFLTGVDGWVFRGQPIYEQEKLMTSLDRAAAFLGEDALAIELRTLKEFKRRAALSGAENLPNDSDTVEWLALLQHYGAPTRLLDFTHSVYVALFFAVEKAKNDSEIWCIRRAALASKLNEPWSGNKNLALQLLLDPEKVKVRMPGVQIGPPPCAVFCDEPYYLNKRLSLQKGCFLIPFDVSKPFRENLLVGAPALRGAQAEEIKDFKDALVKRDIFRIVIPKAQHPGIRRELRRMNLTREHLFPGLDGLATSFWQEY